MSPQIAPAGWPPSMTVPTREPYVGSGAASKPRAQHLASPSHVKDTDPLGHGRRLMQKGDFAGATLVLNAFLQAAKHQIEQRMALREAMQRCHAKEEAAVAPEEPAVAVESSATPQEEALQEETQQVLPEQAFQELSEGSPEALPGETPHALPEETPEVPPAQSQELDEEEHELELALGKEAGDALLLLCNALSRSKLWATLCQVVSEMINPESIILPLLSHDTVADVLLRRAVAYGQMAAEDVEDESPAKQHQRQTQYYFAAEADYLQVISMRRYDQVARRGLEHMKFLLDQATRFIPPAEETLTGLDRLRAMDA